SGDDADGGYIAAVDVGNERVLTTWKKMPAGAGLQLSQEENWLFVTYWNRKEGVVVQAFPVPELLGERPLAKPKTATASALAAGAVTLSPEGDFPLHGSGAVFRVTVYPEDSDPVAGPVPV